MLNNNNPELDVVALARRTKLPRPERGLPQMIGEAPRLTMSPQNSMRRAISWLPIFFLPSLLIAGRLSAQTPTHVRMPMFLSAITVYGGVTMYMFGSANRVGG